MKPALLLWRAGLAALLLPATHARAQTYEVAVVESATHVLNEIMAVPARRIPESMLADAQALAIIPNVVKGGFVVGLRHGRGVLLVRDRTGVWQPPTFVTLTGGSIGWQAGLQATDVILVFKTRNSVIGLMRGKFTIGVDVSVAAGPVGRQATAATDSTLRAEIYSYSRSRGLFAGVALDGSALQVDPLAAATYYRYAAAAPNGNPSQTTVQLPPSAVTLMARVARYTSAPQVAALTAHATRVPPPAVVAPARATADSIRRRLANSAAQLDRLLDVRWDQYLALPAEVYGSDRHPSVEAVRSSLSRFETVLRSPPYETLSRRSEFQSTLQILRQYVKALSSGGNSTLPLPPPPGSQAFPAEFSSGPASRLPVDRGP